MPITKNKKGLFNYDILEKYEAGIELLGPEVKSVKAGNFSFEGSYVNLEKEEIYLVNFHIAPYGPAGKDFLKTYNSKRKRKLLLRKSQIQHLLGKLNQKGLTIIPISLYNKINLIKVEIGLARGKKKYEKRESIKKREDKRKMRDKMKY